MDTSLLELNDQRVVAEISLPNLRHNLRAIRQKLKPGVKLCPVVKANAYGHGAVRVAQTCQDEGVEFFAVGCLSEAVELREAGIQIPILILGPTNPNRASWLCRYNLRQTVSSRQAALELAQALEATPRDTVKELPGDYKIHLHLKLDTGMSRHGFSTASAEERESTIHDILALQRELAAYPRMEIEGLYTHFATNPHTDLAYFQRQVQRFVAVKEALDLAGCPIPLIHCSNSAASLTCPELDFSMVRTGIMVYGSRDGDWMNEEIDLRYVMNFKGRISAIREVNAGEGISYGHSYLAAQKMRVGIVEAGYADGLNRLLSNQVKFLVHDHLAPQVGKICMDRCMCDLSNCPEAQVGDQVLIFGDSEQKDLQVDYQADLMGTIPYELFCNIGPRVPRIYLE